MGEANADCSRGGAGGERGGEVQGVGEMPPTKKITKKIKKGKKKSKDGKLKVARVRGAPPALPPELRALDTEWWYTFLNKQQTELGMYTPTPICSDSSLPLPRSRGVFLNSRRGLLHSTKSAQAAAPAGHYGGRRGAFS
jgi:hypothetical protein